MSKIKIDAVITWVDGQSQSFQQQLTALLASKGMERPESATPTRFNNCGEISYCIASIMKFAPWMNQIFIVTEQPIPPEWHQIHELIASGKVVLIGHEHIFRNYEHNLPTFNSISIESMLWRIEGLAEQFIYFNDDCMLIRPVDPQDFFRSDNLVLRGKWKTITTHKLQSKIWRILSSFLPIPKEKKALGHRLLQEKSAEIAGFDQHFFHLSHVPFALHKSLFEQFFKQNPQILNDNIQYPFRHKDQVWPVSLASHLAYQQGQAHIDTAHKEVTLHGGVDSRVEKKSKLLKAQNNKRVKFICLQSLDEASSKERQTLFSWLSKRLSTPALS